MDFVRRWRKSAARVLVCIAVALFAYFTMKAEASLGMQGVQIMPLEFAPASQ